MSAPIRQDCQIMSFSAAAAQYRYWRRSVLAMAHSRSVLAFWLLFDSITRMDIHVLSQDDGLNSHAASGDRGSPPTPP